MIIPTISFKDGFDVFKDYRNKKKLEDQAFNDMTQVINQLSYAIKRIKSKAEEQTPHILRKARKEADKVLIHHQKKVTLYLFVDLSDVPHYAADLFAVIPSIDTLLNNHSYSLPEFYRTHLTKIRNSLSRYKNSHALSLQTKGKFAVARCYFLENKINNVKTKLKRRTKNKQ
ncbi:TPA: hypothetical protein QHU55_004887 [Klebsiella aerogenes]|uniref:hypothetical protein n=1 Tax=Klebsiella aerogenes TaxID=548 RepID=UPI00274E0351|nr:hypothetical protein [Klebsiella aerogenes]HDS6532772.1 hypothetical protein [Klebsiella aerogenes]HDS7502526.1 hypothetical protein [Klebsiella aerogenes]HDS9642489.1 hypothetical protein [Klebsiella aerogenes]HDT0788060.1 hypothetical protein [Klebsiella aerogenes]